MSTFGNWSRQHGLPVFDYAGGDGDESVTSERDLGGEHVALCGNRRIQLVAGGDGTVGVFDEHDGLRWITAREPSGTGISRIEHDHESWSTDSADLRPSRPAGATAIRRFGPTWFEVECSDGTVTVVRTMLCPEGCEPWVLVRVQISAIDSVSITHTEEWAVRPLFLNALTSPETRKSAADAAIEYATEPIATGIRATEIRTPEAGHFEGLPLAQIFGAPHTVILECLGETTGTAQTDSRAHPTLRIATPLSLEPGRDVELWFRFGLDTGNTVDDPEAVFANSLEALGSRLPRATGDMPGAAEFSWHAAMLTGGACEDGALGGHTLDQASAYSFAYGINAAARDPLQHALPLVYVEPDLALSVLRNTCTWSDPNGDLPYALDGAKVPNSALFQPSDGNLWALWLASEYAAATGDLTAFGEPVAFHPIHNAQPVSLAENLHRQFRFFIDEVGRGEHGHVRMRNADWNDSAVFTSGLPHAAMIERGESVLNSALAAWVLPVYAGLCDRLGDSATADEARRTGDELRELVSNEWNGRWFRRAWGPGDVAIGEDDLWLEVQPWAILCGAADPQQAAALLHTIDEKCRAGSPLGARVLWPVGDDDPFSGAGEATNGGIWFAINGPLVWAAAAYAPELAWDELGRMSLGAHASVYPGVWEGTLAGPDAYNSPESTRPGHTWGTSESVVAMQVFPVGNLHAHAWPLLAYLRLLGVEPTPTGSLRIGPVAGGVDAGFSSQSLSVRTDGSGSIDALGEVTIETPRGVVAGGPGTVSW